MALRDLSLTDASVPETATLAEAVAELFVARVPAVAVLDDARRVLGVLSERDVLKVAEKFEQIKTRPVREIMTPDPVRISVDKDLHHLTAMMHAYHVRRVPIVNGFDTTLGIVTLDDLIAQLGDEMSEIGKAISEEFPQGNA